MVIEKTNSTDAQRHIRVRHIFADCVCQGYSAKSETFLCHAPSSEREAHQQGSGRYVKRVKRVILVLFLQPR